MEKILEMLMGTHGLVASITLWLALICTALLGAVKLTPTKVDDEWAEKILKVPGLGPFLIALIEKSPLKRK